MSAINPVDGDATSLPEDDADFDLRAYLEVVISWWKEILLLALLSAGAAGLGLYLKQQASSPMYEAIADVVTVRLVSQITLDETMETSGETSTDTTAVARRRAALHTLGKSATIAKAVSVDLAEILTEEQQEPNRLAEMVDVESPTTADGRQPSDLIRIRVAADDPDKAAAIANSWAQHYIELVNSVFGQVPPELSESVEIELESAFLTHQAAQSALEAYIATASGDQLQNEINRLVTQRDNLLLGRDQMLTAIVDQDRAARVRFFSDLANAQAQAHYAVLQNQVHSRIGGLTQLYDDRDLAARLLRLARSLEEQIRLGGEGGVSTNQQTLQLLKNQTYSLPVLVDNADGTTSPLPSFTFITESSGALPSAEEQHTDVQAMITALESYIAELDERIGETSQELLAGDGYQFLDQINVQSLTVSAQLSPTTEITPAVQLDDGLSAAIARSYADMLGVGGLVQNSQLGMIEQASLTDTLAELDRQIQELRAERAAEEAAFQLLTQQRDLAWTAYTALSKKNVELGIEETAATTEVRMGSQAIPPAKPIPGASVVSTAAVAGVLGLLLGICLALVASYLGYSPILSRGTA